MPVVAREIGRGVCPPHQRGWYLAGPGAGRAPARPDPPRVHGRQPTRPRICSSRMKPGTCERGSARIDARSRSVGPIFMQMAHQRASHRPARTRTVRLPHSGPAATIRRS
jgi:hypothetical protein